MILANKIAFAGCLSAFLGFFLSWIDVPSVSGAFGNLFSQMALSSSGLGGGESQSVPMTSVSGFGVAKLWGAFYLYPLLAATACVLLYLAVQRHRSYERTMQASGWLVFIGALIGPQLLLLILLVPAIQKLVGLGLWMNAGGFCAIAVGGLMNIVVLSRHTGQAWKGQQ